MANRIDSSGLAGCFRCFHVWRPRNPDPARCPRCKSGLWDVPKLRKVVRGGGLGVPDILGSKRQEVLDTLARNGARNPRVFGSVGRGTAAAQSDLDLLVDFDPGASGFDQIALVDELRKLLDRRVDVATVEGLHWLVRPQVLFEAVPL